MKREIFRQGDIVVIDFNPQIGQERAGRRPALVVSNDYFNARSSVTFVCPITNSDTGYPLHVALDGRTRTKGFVMCEHLRSVDLSGRNPIKKENIPPEILRAVIERLAAVVRCCEN